MVVDGQELQNQTVTNCNGLKRRMVVGGQELQEGQIYTLIFFEKVDDKRKTAVKKRMRLLKFYRHHALFESRKGIRTSFRYWDLGKLLRGEPK